MATLTAANEARLQKSLNQIYRFSEGIMRLGEYLEKYAQGYEAKETAKYQFNRHAYNRMGNREQAEYDEKMKQRKMSYRVIVNKERGTFVEIPKIVFEHFTEIK